MVRTALLLGAGVAFLIAPLHAIDADRDFSGRWSLDPQASRLEFLAAVADPSLVIDQQEMSIRCTASGEAGGLRTWSFFANGDESKYSMGEERRNTVAKWEGAALLINTIVSGPRNYTIMDRWRLSADRSVLRIERQIVRSNGSAEAVLVYRREGQTQLTMRSPAPQVAPPEAPKANVDAEIEVRAGTRIPLSLINSVNTKESRQGDRVYLETAFPIFVENRLAIPRGSYVAGTITRAKPAGRVKGKSEMYIRFDSLTLPNGVTRSFVSRLGSADASASGEVDRREGKITGEGDRGGDVKKVGQGAGMGASVGSIAGAATGHLGMGTAIGGAAGAIAGLAGVLGSRGPEVILPRGTTVEMVLDRDLHYKLEELRF